MNLLKKRLDATDRKLDELKAARKAAQKASRHAHKQSKADRERRVTLAGEAILRQVERGEFDLTEFRRIMDDYLSRPADRALFDLE